MISKLSELRIAQPLHAENDANAENKKDQCRQIARRVQQHQPKERKHSADGIKQDHRLPLGQSQLQ